MAGFARSFGFLVLCGLLLVGGYLWLNRPGDPLGPAQESAAGTEGQQPESANDPAGSDNTNAAPADQAGRTRSEVGSAPDREPVTGTVVFVIDGDTVDMDIDGQRERVRLLGIDAPESVHRSVPEQCFGAESSAALTELLPIGSEVTLERDVEARDRYGRLLLYLYRADDGLFINEQLVRSGMADTSFYQPNTTMEDVLTAARAEARAERAGLWGRCDGPDQPLD